MPADDQQTQPLFDENVRLRRRVTELETLQKSTTAASGYYRDLIRLTPVSICEIDFRTRRFTFVNDAMCRLSGYSREELLEMGPLDLLDEESQALFKARAAQWLAGQEPESEAEYRIRVKDGRAMTAVVHTRFTTDEGGRPAGAVVVVEDVTERKRAEQALRESANRLQAIMEYSRDGITVGDIASGRIILANPAFRAMTGFSPDGIVAMNPQEIIDRLHPDDRAMVLEKLRRVIAGEESTEDVEFRSRVKSGEYRWFRKKTGLIRDREGKPEAIVETVSEVTDLKRAEAALRESEGRLRQLFTAMDEGFCVIEKVETPEGQPSDYRYVMVNPAFERHTGLRDVVGRTIREVVPRSEEGIMDRYDEVARTGEPQLFTDYVTTMDLWMEANVFPTDKPGQIAVLFRNVTELKKAELSLWESERQYRHSHALLAEAEQLAHLGSYEYDITSGKGTWSDEMYRITGLDPAQGPPSYEEFIQRIVHPDDREHIIEINKRQISRKEPGEAEFRIVTPSGLIKWVRSAGRSVINDAGVLAGFYGAILDITERKWAEQERERLVDELAATRTRLEAVLKQMPSGVQIVDLLEGKLILSNEQAIRIYGLNLVPKERWAEYEIYKGWHLDGRPYQPEEWPIPRAISGQTVEEVIEIQRPDGSYLWVNHSAAPIRDESGNVVNVVLVLTDVTERERLLENVQNRATQLDTILASIADGFIMYDPEGNLVRMNTMAEAILGYSAEEARGLPFNEWVATLRPETPEGHPFPPERMPVVAGLRGEPVSNFTIVIHRRPHGKKTWISVSSAPVRHADGKITGVVNTFTDVTSQHERQQQQEDLLRVISHDLRQPLTTILGQS